MSEPEYELNDEVGSDYNYDDDSTAPLEIEEEFESIKIKQKTTEKEEDFISLSQEEMIKDIKESVEKIQELLIISENASKILLKHFNYNTEKLFNIYFEKGRDKLFKEVGIENNIEGKEEDNKNIFSCLGCFEEVEISQTTKLNTCDHRFCNECWKKYINLKIKDFTIKKIHCMYYKCQIVLGDDFLNQFIDEETKEKYKGGEVEEYVSNCKTVSWCPSVPHCGYAIKIISNIPTQCLPVICKCSKEFCFSCKELPHNPATCDMMKSWNTTFEDSSASLKWIEVNTKPCPSCKNIIEKNGGCNRMTCVKCGFEFCWICGNSNFLNHNCSFYQSPSQKKKLKNLKTELNDIQRYGHYMLRYNVHKESFKYENIQRGNIILKMGTNEWIRTAMEVLFICRRYLMNSYVFAYYTFDIEKYSKEIDHKNLNPKDVLRLIKQQNLDVKTIEIYQGLFENCLDDLEKQTETLSNSLQSKIGEIIKNKGKIITLQILAQESVKGLIDIIQKQVMKEYDLN